MKSNAEARRRYAEHIEEIDINWLIGLKSNRKPQISMKKMAIMTFRENAVCDIGQRKAQLLAG